MSVPTSTGERIAALQSAVTDALTKRQEKALSDSELALRAGTARTNFPKWRRPNHQLTLPSTRQTIARAFCMETGVFEAYVRGELALDDVVLHVVEDVLRARRREKFSATILPRPNLQKMLEEHPEFTRHVVTFLKVLNVPEDLTTEQWLAEARRIRDLIPQRVIQQVDIVLPPDQVRLPRGRHPR